MGQTPSLVGYFIPLRAFCLGCGTMVAFTVVKEPEFGVVGEVRCQNPDCRYKYNVLTVDLGSGAVLKHDLTTTDARPN